MIITTGVERWPFSSEASQRFDRMTVAEAKEYMELESPGSMGAKILALLNLLRRQGTKHVTLPERMIDSSGKDGHKDCKIKE
jgi:carbamate kinase